jgi:hypothetical protein
LLLNCNKDTKNKLKTESGKRKTFVFRLERESGSDERSNGERLLAGYLLQGGAKACEAGLKRKTFVVGAEVAIK